jgi:hypothetical protein
MADDLSGSTLSDRHADEDAIRELLDRQIIGWDAGDLETIVPAQSLTTGLATPRVFQVEVTNQAHDDGKSSGLTPERRGRLLPAQRSCADAPTRRPDSLNLTEAQREAVIQPYAMRDDLRRIPVGPYTTPRPR